MVERSASHAVPGMGRRRKGGEGMSAKTRVGDHRRGRLRRGRGSGRGRGRGCRKGGVKGREGTQSQSSATVLWTWWGVLRILSHHDLQDRGERSEIIRRCSDQGGFIALSNAVVVVVTAHNRHSRRGGEGRMSGYLT